MDSAPMCQGSALTTALCVCSGTLTARPDSDFTVKQDITGLQPNTTYYYAFRQGDYSSHLGRTRTLPALDQ